MRLIGNNPGFSSNTSMAGYKVEDETNKLTIEEMNGYDMYKDIDQALIERRGQIYTGKHIRGLPFGLKLSNGTTVDPNTKL